MPTPRWYIRTHILGKRIEFLRGNVAWEVTIGNKFVQAFYRRFWHTFGVVKVGRF